MTIIVYTGNGNFNSYDNVTKFKTGGTYDRTLHIWSGKDLIAIYNTNAWTKIVKAERVTNPDHLLQEHLGA